jgi:hypothetical protein
MPSAAPYAMATVGIDGTILKAIREHVDVAYQESGLTQDRLIDQLIKRVIMGPSKNYTNVKGEFFTDRNSLGRGKKEKPCSDRR